MELRNFNVRRSSEERYRPNAKSEARNAIDAAFTKATNQQHLEMPAPEAIQHQRFKPSHGFMTRKIQQQFLEKQIELGRMGPEVLDDEKVTSLEASEDLSDPLFFWQIYSLTGRAPVKAVAEAFYDRVFEDEEEWFREVFAKLSAKSYHITAQMMMYVDCFGGGRLYWGGEDRADMHHGETAARAIMTQKAAERWNVHMNGALEQETPALDAIDPRIRVALNTFLSFFFDKYASKFEFDASCVDFGETYPPRK